MSDKLKNIVVTSIFMASLIIIMFLNILKTDTLISQTERRKLASFPEISIEKILDKTFMDKFDKYAMDQFIKRDAFRKIKNWTEIYAFNKKDVNSLYSQNNIIIKSEYPLNEKSVENTCNKINTIINDYLNDNNNIYYSIIPDKNYFLDNSFLRLDYEKLENIMNSKIQNANYIRIFDNLKLDDYYYSDTHWKQENLLNVLDTISTSMNFKDRIHSSFEKNEITKFYGVYNGQYLLNSNEDTINVLTNTIIENATVFNFETNKETQVYDLEKLNSNDKYDIYLSGAATILKIENKLSTTDKELIVFRDSYGSSLVPLFTEGYKTITLVDTRYIAPKYLKDYIDFSNKDVLFIYSTLVINNSSALK